MDEILSALACIPVRTCSYAEWLGIGMALKDAGYECAVWDDWSRDDKRYVEGDCARRWATFKGLSLIHISRSQDDSADEE